jgi:hypothetical protein
VSDHHNRGRWSGRGQIGIQPRQLRTVKVRAENLVVLDSDGVENNEVPPLIIEGVVELSKIVLIELLPVLGIAGLDRASLIDPDDVVISDGVVDLACQLRLGLAIPLEEHVRPAEVLFADIEYLVAAGDAELGAGFVNLVETFCAPDCSRQLRLQMGVREKYEIEISRGIRLRQELLIEIA